MPRYHTTALWHHLATSASAAPATTTWRSGGAHGVESPSKPAAPTDDMKMQCQQQHQQQHRQYHWQPTSVAAVGADVASSTCRMRARRALNRACFKTKRLKRQTVALALLTLFILATMVRIAVKGLAYLMVLPYSQFTYPLEMDFGQLLGHYEAHGTYPSGAVAINNASFPVLHRGDGICQRQGPPPHLLILVKSGLSNRHFRDAVRATWANRLSYGGGGSDGASIRVRHAFVLGGGGTPLEQERVDAEQAMHGDIVQQAFVDAYYNNTYKTMFAFDWAARNCPGAAFVLFADDDYYVSPPNLAGLVRRLWRRRGADLAIGYVFARPVPKRSPLDRWYTTLGEYPFAFWPPYPTGGAVLATASFCRRVSVVQRFVRYLRFDDVFLGIVMRKLAVLPEHHGLFYYELLTPLRAHVYRHVIAMHLDRRIHLLQRIWSAMNYTWHDVPVISLRSRSLLAPPIGGQR